LERRRHVRHKACAIVCVKLNNNNGGILLNLGTGGLSFQAVTKVHRDQNLVLSFKLPDSGESIQIEGTVAWLGPTRKEAGICFTDVTHRANQLISQWIAEQGAPSGASELTVTTPAKPSLVTSEILLSPPDIIKHKYYFKVIDGEPEMNSHSSTPPAAALETGLPDSSAIGQSEPYNFATSFAMPIPALPDHEEHSDESVASPNDFPQEPSQTILNPEMPASLGLSEVQATRAEEAAASPELISPTNAFFGHELFPADPILSTLVGKLRRERLVALRIVSCAAILGLIVISINLHKNPGRNDSSSSTAINFARPNAVAPNASGTAKINKSQEQHKIALPAAQSGSVSTLPPIPALPMIVQKDKETGWISWLKTIFPSIDRNSGSGNALAGVLVWTHARSGYYYCAQSPYFEKLQPGSIMKQSDALQNGYQPKLGSYCQ